MKTAVLAFFCLAALYVAGPARWLVIAGAGIGVVIWHLAGGLARHIVPDD